MFKWCMDSIATCTRENKKQGSEVVHVYTKGAGDKSTEQKKELKRYTDVGPARPS